jgi:protein CpxP
VKKQLILPAALLLALGATTALNVPASFAQDASGTTAQAPAVPAGTPAGQPQRPQRSFHSHIEGRIAYLKAELKITPAQQASFDKVAQAMRDNATARQKGFDDARAQRGKPHNAVDILNARIKMSQDRARDNEHLLTAFKPLYDSLSPDQKKVADEMAMPHHFDHRGMHRG